jgi:hypothetical protein
MMRWVSWETCHLWTKKNFWFLKVRPKLVAHRAENSGWRHLILSRVLWRRASCRDSTSCPWISTEVDFLLDAWVTLVLTYLLGCCSVGSLEETALLDLENWTCRVSPRRQGSPSVELLINSAVSLLLNLGAARHGRSACFQVNKSYYSKVGKRGLLWTPNWILWDVD